MTSDSVERFFGSIGFCVFASFSLINVCCSRQNQHEPDENHSHKIKFNNIKRSDSEFSIGLNRSESVEASLTEYGQPCFYSWPSAIRSIIRDNLFISFPVGALIVGGLINLRRGRV